MEGGFEASGQARAAPLKTPPSSSVDLSRLEGLRCLLSAEDMDMAYMNWRSTYEVGHAKIDEQHKSLVEAINTLHTAMKQGKGKEEVQRILVFLRDYTVDHFKTEESLMDAHRYPGATAHKSIHTDLVKQVAGLVADYQNGMPVITGAVLDFLENWLTKHIMSEDMALGAFLKSKGVTA
jgi:hemerythrin